jgi:hypothetical protein
VGIEFEINNSKERPVRLLNTLGGKAMYEETQLQTETLRSSIKLCQVGIEPVQGVHRRTLL